MLSRSSLARAAAAAPRPTKVRHVAMLGKLRGRHVRAITTGNTYAIDREAEDKRTINADFVHKESGEDFHMERRWFYRAAGKNAQFATTWDRVAQALILMTRPQPRVVPEAAFRLFAVFLKLMMLDRITSTTASMLPLWASANAQNIIESGIRKRDENKPADATNTSAAAAIDAATAQPAAAGDAAAAPDAGSKPNA
jgi:hypothetical protein